MIINILTFIVPAQVQYPSRAHEMPLRFSYMMISLHKDMIYQCMKLNKKKIIEKRRPKNPFVQRQKGDRFCLVPQFSGCSVQLPTIHSIQFEEFNKHRKHQMFRLNCMFFTTAHALNWSTQNGWILFVLVVVVVFFFSLKENRS